MLPDRILNKITESPEGCHLWTGYIQNGYGIAGLNGKQHRVQRLIYEEKFGPIPEGLVLDHICRVRACVNPAHLRAITNKENILCGEGITAANKRKTHCPRGHEYSGDNLRLSSDGGRNCRTCEAKYRTTRHEHWWIDIGNSTVKCRCGAVSLQRIASKRRYPKLMNQGAR